MLNPLGTYLLSLVPHGTLCHLKPPPYDITLTFPVVRMVSYARLLGYGILDRRAPWGNQKTHF